MCYMQFKVFQIGGMVSGRINWQEKWIRAEIHSSYMKAQVISDKINGICAVNVVSRLLDIFSLVLNFVIGYGYIGGKTASSMIGVYDRRRAVIDHSLTDRGRKKA